MVNEHTHHWRIEPPNGPTSRGRCKECGEYRLFPNSANFSTWNPLNKDRKSKITEDMLKEAISRQGRKEATWREIADDYGINRRYLHKLVKEFRERPDTHSSGYPVNPVIQARRRKLVYVTT